MLPDCDPPKVAMLPYCHFWMVTIWKRCHFQVASIWKHCHFWMATIRKYCQFWTATIWKLPLLHGFNLEALPLSEGQLVRAIFLKFKIGGENIKNDFLNFSPWIRRARTLIYGKISNQGWVPLKRYMKSFPMIFPQIKDS